MSDKALEHIDDAQMQYISLLIDSGCKVLFTTEHFGKPYVWMKDRTGRAFMERLPNNLKDKNA